MTQKKNRTVLVTGASKGIGKSIAKLLADSGYSVYICARNEEVLIKTAQEIEAKGSFAVDLTEECCCKKLVDFVVEKEGSLDILINNAGEYIYSPIEKTEEIDVKKMIALNVEAPYLLTKYAVLQMKKNGWGRIVNIGSISGSVGEANASLYSMTKSSLIGFTKALALELAQDNITVNTINPGWVDTDFAKEAIDKSDFSYDEEIEMIPQRRFIHPDEIASLALYLISKEAKGMTGQSINLCAGLSVG